MGKGVLKSFIILAIRNIKKYKLSSFISIFGLSFGMASFLIILGFIRFEENYDKFHTDSDQIYQVCYIKKSSGGNEYKRILTGPPLAVKLQLDYPEISAYTRIQIQWDHQMQYGEKEIKTESFYYADNSLFDVFSFDLSSGDEKTALSDPNSIVISKQIAEKTFGDKNPIGEVLKFYDIYYGKELDLKITGVLNEIPKNSTLNFDIIASYSTLKSLRNKRFFTDRWETSTWTYIRLNHGVDVTSFKSKIYDFPKKSMPESIYRPIGLSILPFKDLYFEKTDGLSNGAKGNKTFSYFLFILSGIVLIISCLNFINLTIARSNERVKEIGIRKTFGARKKGILFQLLIENLVLSSIAVVFSIILIELVSPYFSELISEFFNMLKSSQKRELIINDYVSASYWLTLILTVVFTSLTTVIYPTVLLNKTQVINVLGGKRAAGKTKSYFQMGMVSLQFIVTSVVLVASLHITRQFEFVLNENFEFQKDNRVIIPVGGSDLQNKIKLIKSELKRNLFIKNVTATAAIPGIQQVNGGTYSTNNTEKFNSHTYFVDHDFLNTYEIKLIEGNDFSEQQNRNQVIINQLAAKKFNLKINDNVNLIDKKGNVTSTKRVVGISNDFRHRGFVGQDKALIIQLRDWTVEYLTVHFEGCSKIELHNLLNSVWTKLNSDRACPYEFLDEKIKSAHGFFTVIDKVVKYASFVVLILALLGLFALSYFTIERKAKEIGIRKIVGASRTKILNTITVPFIKIVIFSFLITIPFSYWLVDSFLADYPHNLGMSVELYLLSFLILLGISILTISYKTFLAANTNPVNVLRNE